MEFGESIEHEGAGVVCGCDTGLVIATFSHEQEADSFVEAYNSKPVPADKPAVAVPVFSESDLIEIASSYSAYAGADTDLYLNAWINSGEAKGFIDLINDRSAPSHSQQSADSSDLVALLGVMCGWFEILAKKAGWNPENAGSAFFGYQKAKLAMLSSKYSVQHKAINIESAKAVWVNGYETGHNDGIGCGHALAQRCRHSGEKEFDEREIRDLLDRCPIHESEQP